MLLFVLFGILRVSPALNHGGDISATAADSTAMGQFPQHLGAYTLIRTWNENLTTGLLLFHWAEYAPAGGGPHISLGVAPVIGSHDTLICHSARGEDPLWHAALVTPTVGDPATSFSAAFFNDSATQFLELTTICTGTACGEYAASRTHLGFVYSRPHPESIFVQNPNRPIPILLRAETLDATTPPDLTRRQLSGAMQGLPRRPGPRRAHPALSSLLAAAGEPIPVPRTRSPSLRTKLPRWQPVRRTMERAIPPARETARNHVASRSQSRW